MIEQHLTDAVKAAVREVLAEQDGVIRLTYTVKQAADALQVSQTTVRQLVAAGHLGTVPHLGSRVVIPRADLEALVRGERVERDGGTHDSTLRPLPGPAESESPDTATAPLVPLRPPHPAGGGPTSDEPLGAA